MLPVRFTLALLCLGLSLPAGAAVYKYVDIHGTVTYTNIPVRGAQPVKLPPLSGFSSPRKAAPSSSGSAAPGAYPEVDKSTQMQRDEGRKKLLAQELTNEQAALDEARRALETARKGDDARSPSGQDKLRRLTDAVTEREKNIAALRTEISRADKTAPK